MGRVLVVDDNRDLDDTTAALLRAHDLEVMTLYEGVGVLSEVDRRVPDVIVLDIGLPGVDGVDLARRIRERYGNAVRLIACTAYGDEDTRQKMRQAGFDAMFTKPAPLARLLEAIATAPVRAPDNPDRRKTVRGV
jgi:DNA-binding response OmpR family regulator